MMQNDEICLSKNICRSGILGAVCDKDKMEEKQKPEN